MSVASGPSLVSNGLVFAYDMASPVSYKGPVLNNIAQAASIIGTGTSTGYSSIPVVQDEYVPGLGYTQVLTNLIQNNYTSYTPTNNNCCPSLHAWGGIVVSPSTLYTYGIVFRVDSGYTSPNYMYRYEYASNGGAYVTEGGVYSDANRVDLGGGWYYAWGTFTTQATTNYLGHCGTFYYRYSNTNDRLSIAKVMIAPGNYSGMHPKYWPSFTSRSTVQTLSDIGGSNPVIANGLTYNSDGTFSLANNYAGGIEVPNNNFTTLGDLTMNCIMKYTGTQDHYTGAFMSSGDWNVNHWAFGIGQNGTTIDLRNPTLSYSYTFTTNQWYMVTWVRSGTSNTIYINGTSIGTQTSAAAIPLVSNASNTMFGRETYAGGYFNLQGELPLSQIYNRALSSDEVLRNFNALRGRYSI
jgi:hypothetical protein